MADDPEAVAVPCRQGPVKERAHVRITPRQRRAEAVAAEPAAGRGEGGRERVGLLGGHAAAEKG